MRFSDHLKKYSAVDCYIGTDKIITHSYDKIYDDLFQTYEHNCTKLLEIGFASGFSLLSYSEYFKNAVIYGIDIYDNRHEFVKTFPNINVYIGDATHDDTIKAFPFEFDIIVEDASHLPEHQIQHFKDYSPYIKSGGVYVIEDIDQTNYMHVYNNVLSIATQNGLTCELIDLREIKNRFDDIVIVCKRL
jgi:hypothetical protein